MVANSQATLAKQLDKYMRFRAKHEGMPYEMTPEDYYPYMCIGVRDFFGVHVTMMGWSLTNSGPTCSPYGSERPHGLLLRVPE
jgi:hypothetical protein